ncbi:MAG TPA: hypothetical protein VLT62_19890 [Candidatus Methylomirabilis sp.]|nr:hypothetical protein [Candidatus Methylomirabilis sp.]HSB82569.1 hypothetical protein [Candidatus Methylomirabilis sp.]
MGRIARVAGTSLVMAASFLLTSAGIASAHGFGQRYDLPVPLSLYVTGAAAAVAFSFVIIAVFVRGTPGLGTYPRVNLLRYPIGRFLAHTLTLLPLKLASTSAFALVILAGLLGNQHPLRNVGPTLVWVIWWVGLAYVSALGGNIWALVNPWKVLFEWTERVYRRFVPGGGLSLRLPYPETLGVWPTVVLFLGFSWVELVSGVSAEPAVLAILTLGYSILTWTGMFLFGSERWLGHGEAFTLAFGVLARLAPTEVRVVGNSVCEGCSLDCRDRDGECINCYGCFVRAEPTHREWNLRPYAVGLLRNEPISFSMMAFVLLLLSTVSFDGFMATPVWASIEEFMSAHLPDLNGTRLIVIRTLGLVAFPLLFLGIYSLVSALMSRAGDRRRSTGELARSFALSLVPIAVAYHTAHYLSFLLIQGQLLIPLASDPFGFGWNLLGTAGYRIDIGIVGARFAWYSAVVAIVAGHIIAVYLAHLVALRTFRDRNPALRTQYPMSALMVGYTMVSLWILAQPIVEIRTPTPATAEASTPGILRVPADALIPEPGTGRLGQVGDGKVAREKLTYRLLDSSFHDGTRVSVADLLYPYALAYRWGVRDPKRPSEFDRSIEESTALLRQSLAGVKVLRVEKTVTGFGEIRLVHEVPVVEVYLNSRLRDPQQLASIAPPWSSLPWDLIVLMEEAVVRGWAAFSLEEATRRGVEWMDLARGARLKDRLASLVEEFERRGYVPDPLKGLVTAQVAKERWAALGGFYRAHGHFLVTNGPYMLEKWAEESVVLKAFRDLSYPLGVGSFDAYAIPRRAYISKIRLEADRLEVWADVEKVEKFQRSYDIVREPFRGQPASAVRPDTLTCQYVILGPTGEVVKAGAATLGDGGVFTADLKGALGPGLYTVMTALYLNENFMNPEIKAVQYRVGGAS